jgi:hypothetical protein
LPVGQLDPRNFGETVIPQNFRPDQVQSRFHTWIAYRSEPAVVLWLDASILIARSSTAAFVVHLDHRWRTTREPLVACRAWDDFIARNLASAN